MKYIFVLLLLILQYNFSYAQVISKQEIEEYTNIGDMTWTAKAEELSCLYTLNENGELSLSIIKEYKDQSKSQLYKKIFNWILSISSNAKSDLLVSDENLGQIQARCYIPDIAKRTMGDNSYRVSIRPLLKFDFKEGKMRFTFTLQCFEVMKKNDDSGYVIMFGGGYGVTGSGVIHDNQTWPLKECYPFTPKRRHPKVTSSRAFVNTLSCYNILMDKIDEVIMRPLSIENDNW